MNIQVVPFLVLGVVSFLLVIASFLAMFAYITPKTLLNNLVTGLVNEPVTSVKPLEMKIKDHVNFIVAKQ